MTLERHTLVSLLCAPVIAGILVATSAAPAVAQPPRQQSRMITQAQAACDAAASRNGYQVMRRDRETVNGSSYNLPMHVSHAGAEGDVTCRYDTQRGVADMPRWENRQGYNNGQIDNGNRRGDREARMQEMTQNAQNACQNYLSTRRGYQVVQMGTATRQGQNSWNIPVTVRRNNGRRDQTVTCRYNAASNKVSLR
jgi:hypothetical protein